MGNSQHIQTLREFSLWTTNHGPIRFPGQVRVGKVFQLRVEYQRNVRVGGWVTFKHDGYYLVLNADEQTKTANLQFLAKTISSAYKVDEDQPKP